MQKKKIPIMILIIWTDTRHDGLDGGGGLEFSNQ